MKTIIQVLLSLTLLIGTASCTDYNFVETGQANGVHQTTMWGYFQTDAYNWDSLMVMVRHADASAGSEDMKLQELFEGKTQYGKDITFLGITNHSIRRYLLQNEIDKVADIPAEDCRNFILSSVLDEWIDLDGFLPGKPSTDFNNVIGTGGKEYVTLSGKPLWIYTFSGAYEGVPGAGPTQIFIVSKDSSKKTVVASCNIITQTGIVHSLSYDFTLNDF